LYAGAKTEGVPAFFCKRSMLNATQPNIDIPKGIPNPAPKATFCELLLGQCEVELAKLGLEELAKLVGLEELAKLGLEEFDTAN